MSVFLRKHFWAVNLVSIALCAFFAARAVGRLRDAAARWRIESAHARG
jgi:hypothetical protein